MKFLCLICAEVMMEQMPAAAAEKHYEEYADHVRESTNQAVSIGVTGVPAFVIDGKICRRRPL